MKKSIIISGVTGFLGSHIADYLTLNYNVFGVTRKKSNTWRLNEINNPSIKLLDIDESDFWEKVNEIKPYCFIHCAWQGVAANNRNNWIEQSENFDFSINLLNNLQKAGLKKFISLGSQAEYGYFDNIVNEKQECNPYSAYGATKLATFNYTKAFCEEFNINWFWLRLFPLYGLREDENWFIPMLINKALKQEPIDLTLCEQQYAYLHISDFVEAIKKITDAENVASGLFNISNFESIKIKDIIELIKKEVHSINIFNIGKLPYRKNQVMLLQGCTKKFYSTFNFTPKTNFETSIKELVQYYNAKLKNV